MPLHLQNIVKSSALLMSVIGLSSCSVRIPDDDFLREQVNFNDHHVPDHRVTGKWMMYAGNRYLRASSGIEDRFFFDFQPGGGGAVRVSTGNIDTGGMIQHQATLKWGRTSNNRWYVEIPDHQSFREIHVETRSPSSWAPPRSFAFLYSNGRLYNLERGRIMVPMHEVTRHLDRIRADDHGAQPSVIQATIF